MVFLLLLLNANLFHDISNQFRNVMLYLLSRFLNSRAWLIFRPFSLINVRIIHFIRLFLKPFLDSCSRSVSGVLRNLEELTVEQLPLDINVISTDWCPSSCVFQLMIHFLNQSFRFLMKIFNPFSLIIITFFHRVSIQAKNT